MDAAAVLDIVPGARLADGLVVPEDLDAPFPTPHGFTPPVEWLLEPHHDVIPGATGLITADGRFCAYSHEWDRCHVSFTGAGECWTPPRSATGNRMFHQSRTTAMAADGTIVEIPTGVVPFGGGHAPLDATVAEASQWYDRPDVTKVIARAVEVDDGCVMCGFIVPGTTHREVALMRASALSGDWRWVPQIHDLDFLGPCFVARPGLPLSLEHAAIEQALWQIERTTEVSRTASGQISAVVGGIVSWAPRPAVTDHVPAAVIAAAVEQTGDEPMPACKCQQTDTETTPATVAAPVLPSHRNRTAAAGTSLSFRELEESVQEALIAAFGTGPDPWVWVKDFDDTWAVIELERSDPILGTGTGTYQVAITINADGTVLVDRMSATEVETVFQPVGGGTPESIEALPMVTAHASDAAAIAEIRAELERALQTVEAQSADIARLTAQSLEPAEIVEQLPEAPEPV
jgi:hypothetical protein